MVLESEFPPDVRVENEIKALHKAGHKIDIACFTKTNRPSYEETEFCNIFRRKIGTFTYKSSIGALNFNFYFNFWRKFLLKLLNLNNYDVVHIHDLPLTRVAVELRQRFSFKLTVDLHENWPALLDLSEHTKSFAGKILCSIPQWIEYERKYLLQADQVIVVVEEAKSRVAKLGVNKSIIHVVSNTLETALFAFPNQKPVENKFVMVYGGGVNYHRGLQNVIQAIPGLIRHIPEIELWIIGTGRYLKKLEELAKKLKIEDHIIFYGWQKQEKLLKLVSQAHIAVIPHIKSDHTDNTIPHKLFQYMYAGIPIVSSNCNPIERIINETHSGIIYKDSDKNDLIEKVCLIYKNKINYNPNTPRNAVIEKYNWDKDAKELIDLYNII